MEKYEINELILEISYIKVINFPKNLKELHLIDMNLYSFSDFPDFVEKIFIKKFEYTFQKQGKFPANLNVLHIEEFHHDPSEKTIMYFFHNI